MFRFTTASNFPKRAFRQVLSSLTFRPIKLIPSHCLSHPLKQGHITQQWWCRKTSHCQCLHQRPANYIIQKAKKNILTIILRNLFFKNYMKIRIQIHENFTYSMDKSQNNFVYEQSSTCHSQFYKICFSKSETNKILRYRIICHYNSSHSWRICYADIHIYIWTQFSRLKD